MSARILAAVVPVFMISLSSCAAGFEKIEFKYTSLTHLGFAKSRTASSQSPAETTQNVADFLRGEGATVVGIDKNVSQPLQTDADSACEDWVLSIHLAELEAIRRNSWSEYKGINREKMPDSCAEVKPSWLQYGFSQRTVDDASGFLISAEFDRSINYNKGVLKPSYSTIFGPFGSASGWSMQVGEREASADFRTKVYVQIWGDADGDGSNVFVWALPSSHGIDAAPGSTIGRYFYQQVDGTIEARVVRNVIAFIDQISISGDSVNKRIEISTSMEQSSEIETIEVSEPIGGARNK